MKAVVLHSEIQEEAGRDEKDVLVQADVVSSALADLGYEPVSIPFSLNVAKTAQLLKNIRPAFVFNLVETVEGQGSLIHIAPSILDFLRLPYTGAGTEATFLTSNKVLAKKCLIAANIDTPPFCLPHEDSEGMFAEGAYIIKSVWEHASTWLDENSIISAGDMQGICQAILTQQKKIGVPCFAEAFVEGREFNLSLLTGDEGPEVLPPAEIRFDDFPPGKHRVVDYCSKWVEDSFEYHHTPRCFDFSKEDVPLLKNLTRIALQCWLVFGLRGYARVDFRVDKSGQPWVLEINTNPSLSPDGGFYAAVEQSGLTFVQAIEWIIKDMNT